MLASARLVALALLAVALLLGPACGGSGGGGGSPTEPGRPTVAQIEAQSFGLLNAARQAAGLQPLLLDPALSAIARSHSEAMRDRGFFGHVDPVTGMSFPERLAGGGQGFRSAGENLVQVTNAADPGAMAHDRLLASPEHRAAILDPSFGHVGVGAASSGTTYWITQLFVER
jgi:uncharacterized protein YkwD